MSNRRNALRGITWRDFVPVHFDAETIWISYEMSALWLGAALASVACLLAR